MKNLIRRFIRNGRENLISLIGLSLGMMVMILCLSYVVFENSYDKFHSKADRIATVYTRHETSPGQAAMSTSIESGLKFFTERNVPDVEASARVKSVTSKIEAGENSFNGIKGYLADAEFFEIFDFKVLSGSIASFEPGKVVITEELAGRLYGRSDCVGETVTISGSTGKSIATVSAVVRDYPDNSNLEFELIIPLPAIGASGSLKESDDVNLYLLLRNEPDSYSGLKGALDQYFISSGNNHLSAEIIPVVKLHKYWETYFSDKSGSQTALIFLAVSLMVLFISTVNYVNIQYARSETRLREIGLRKVNGATRGSILKMMATESVILVMVSSILGLLLSDIFMGKFQDLTASPVSLFGPGLFILQVLIVTVALVLGILTGFLTSFRYSGYNPANMVKGNLSMFQRFNLRKIVMSLQFAISGGLIAVIVILSLQLNHLRHAEMGFEKHDRLLIKLSPAMNGRYGLIRETIASIAAVEKITGKASGFGEVDLGFGMYNGEPIQENRLFAMAYIVEDSYFETYAIEVLEGKCFEEVSGRDSNLVVIDEYTVGLLGLENPVGHRFKAAGMTLEIIGVVKDADLRALNSQRIPRFYTQMFNECSEITVKYRDGITDLHPLIDEIESALISIDPDYHIEYRLLEDAVWELYGKERDLFKIILICGILAIVLSVTGAYSMASFMAERELKKNSIRRVLGASANSLTMRSIVILGWPVMIGVIISWPIVKILTTKWMESFLSKVESGIYPYVFSILLVGLFVALTVYSVSIRSSVRNPADLLRQE
jgi:putative ABC transport system permease protein